MRSGVQTGSFAAGRGFHRTSVGPLYVGTHQSCMSVTRRTIAFPPKPQQRTLVRIARGVAGVTLGPLCTLAAALLGGPGTRAHVESARLGLSLLTGRADRFPRSLSFAMTFWPLDSTRYPEFDFCARQLDRTPQVRDYLDVSSPRLLPTIVLRRFGSARARLLNPDAQDLPVTRALLEDLGLAARCVFVQDVLTAETAPAGEFDLVTCMSVLEHVPDDRHAIEAIWAAVRPGGQLLLTVPCRAEAEDQYVDVNQYGVLDSDEEGLVFRQRLYSRACLQARVFAITGAPSAMDVWGEREPGYILRDALDKWGSLSYPFWAEALRARTRLARYPNVDALPGEGVACMAFVKGWTQDDTMVSGRRREDEL